MVLFGPKCVEVKIISNKNSGPLKVAYISQDLRKWSILLRIDEIRGGVTPLNLQGTSKQSVNVFLSVWNVPSLGVDYISPFSRGILFPSIKLMGNWIANQNVVGSWIRIPGWKLHDLRDFSWEWEELSLLLPESVVLVMAKLYPSDAMMVYTGKSHINLNKCIDSPFSVVRLQAISLNRFW